MHRLLTVINPAFREEHFDRIRQAAEAKGFEVVCANIPEGVADRIPETEILFGAGVDLVKKARELRWLCVPSAGVDPYVKPGVFVREDAVLSNSSGAYGVTISEHIIMVTLELLRRQQEYNDIVERRGWKRDLPIRSIRESRVTILGTGDLGREAAARFRGFLPASVVGVSRSGRPAEGFDRVIPQSELDTVLPDTDILVMCLPGTSETAHMMDARRLALLPEDAFLINVGRGSALDQRALEELLLAGRFGGAALDVFETEPLPPEDSLWTCPRLLVTPHVAGNMTLGYTVRRIVELFLEDFDRYCRGERLLRAVDRSRGY